MALAISGAAIATLGGILSARSAGGTARLGRILLWAGYAISGTSVILFIAKGFMSPG